MTHGEKWQRIEEIDLELKTIELRWVQLVEQKIELMLIRVAPLMPKTKLAFMKLSWQDAEKRASEIRMLIANGLSKTEIAEQLSISRSLVNYYLRDSSKAVIRSKQNGNNP